MAIRKVVHKKTRVTASMGNVFKDLGFRDSEAEMAKAQLAHRIVTVIEERELTQSQAARVLGVDQPGVSHLVRGDLKRFSMERLFRFLNSLGRDVEIVVERKPRSRKRASTRVTGSRVKPRKSA